MELLLHDLRDEVKKIYGEWFDQYKSIADQSRAEWMRTMQAGRPVPEDGRIYGEYWQNEFSEVTDKSNKKALDVIVKGLASANGIITKAPSDDAVKVVELLKMRAPGEKIENQDAREAFANEIDAFMNAYPNYSVYETLKDIADKAGIKDFKEHDAKKELEILDELERLVNRYISKSVILNGVKDTDKTGFEMAVDSAGDHAPFGF